MCYVASGQTIGFAGIAYGKKSGNTANPAGRIVKKSITVTDDLYCLFPKELESCLYLPGADVEYGRVIRAASI